MKKFVMGNEAAALSALRAEVRCVYGYPGTPSSEIIPFLKKEGGCLAEWCSNEKTALEAALGVSFNGYRAMVTMKHVGLNVAADPFMNAAQADIRGGLVVLVADDPSQHSSQNEQDSRFYADFARIVCLEPESIPEVYAMVGEAFELSEIFHIPVLVKMVTRLAHAHAEVAVVGKSGFEPKGRADFKDWNFVPLFAKKRYERLVRIQEKMVSSVAALDFNYSAAGGETLVISTGLGGSYVKETLRDHNLDFAHLHIGGYPYDRKAVLAAAEGKKKIIVVEEGQPFVERHLRGVFPVALEIAGKLDETLPPVGELTPESVAQALTGNRVEPSRRVDGWLVKRPPQLCQGCSHRDSFTALKELVERREIHTLYSDIGCYSLGSLPPLGVPSTLVDMGASITMAKGAADIGEKNVIAVIGDSTFFHSGLTGLIDCIKANSNMVVVILDNSTTAMTGGQDTVLPSSGIERAAIGLGLGGNHVVRLDALPGKHAENLAVIEKELDYQGLSVVIMARECIQTLKKKK